MTAPAVIVIGEILVELSSDQPLSSGSRLTLGFSGDALNAAAASAAAGASTAVLTRVADDELGEQILARLVELDIDTSLVRIVPGRQGIYFVHADPLGSREFVYSRTGSAGAGLESADVLESGIEECAVVLASGVTCAISYSAAAAVLTAAGRTSCFVYDPNFRPGLTSAGEAAESLTRLAPLASLVTPACPGETGPLLGINRPRTAAARLRELGAAAVAVTRGADGVLLDDGSDVHDLPSLPAPGVVDQTGAGDSLVGTVAGRLALGDSLVDAVRLGCAAASLSLQGHGGSGFVATLAQSRAHLASYGVDFETGRAPRR